MNEIRIRIRWRKRWNGKNNRGKNEEIRKEMIDERTGNYRCENDRMKDVIPFFY